MLGRRRFLAVAGYGAAALVSACAGGPRPQRCGSAGDPTRPPDWTALRTRLGRRLLLPGDAGYAGAARPYNTRFAGRRPRAVAYCTQEADVQMCLETGRSQGLPTAARGGGHSYAAYSTPEGGLVADLAGMAGITVGRYGVAEVGAGARVLDIHTTLAGAGRCLAAGTCASLGIAGLTLGGGIGVLSRMFGLTCDQLLAARMVAPDGRIVLASPQSDPELFWALRGGGGGNFGIVTKLWLRTQPLPRLALFELAFPDGATPDVLGAWQRWMRTAPDELWMRVLVSGGSPPKSTMQGCYVGPTTQAASQISGFLRQAGTQPTSQAVWEAGFLDGMRYFAAAANDTGTHEPGQAFHASSRVQQHPADPAAVTGLLAGRDRLTVLFEPLGAAIARVPVEATAFPHRQALATAQVYALADADHPDTAAEVAAVQNALATAIGTGAYINYIDPAQPDWATASYGPNLPGLRAIGRTWDPDGVLTFPQGLAPCP